MASEYYSYDEMLHELETRAKKRYIEKYSKEDYKWAVQIDNGIRDIVDEVLTKEELKEYLRIDFTMNGNEHLFYELFGDDDR